MEIQKFLTIAVVILCLGVLCYIFFYSPVQAVTIAEIKSSCLNIAAQVCGVTYVS